VLIDACVFGNGGVVGQWRPRDGDKVSFGEHFDRRASHQEGL
jgi:hypothetical protein